MIYHEKALRDIAVARHYNSAAGKGYRKLVIIGEAASGLKDVQVVRE